MDRILSQYIPFLYASLRIVAGLLFAVHGSQKLFGIPGGSDTVPLLSLMGFGGIVEFAFMVSAKDLWYAAHGPVGVVLFPDCLPKAQSCVY